MTLPSKPPPLLPRCYECMWRKPKRAAYQSANTLRLSFFTRGGAKARAAASINTPHYATDWSSIGCKHTPKRAAYQAISPHRLADEGVGGVTRD